MRRYCLDTSAYSHFKRGHAPVVELVDEASWIGIPSIVLGELWVGFLQGNRAERNRQELADFLSHPLVEELPVDHEVGKVYAGLVVYLQKIGNPLPVNDIWIAATAVSVGVPVLTYDPHFAVMKQVNSLILPAP